MEEMILKGTKFTEIYGKQSNVTETLTPYFKSYIDSIAPYQFLKTALITGYIMRIVEEECLNEKIVTNYHPSISGRVREIIMAKLTKQQKITRLNEYFDLHDKIGLGEPVKPFTILPFEETKHYFNFLVEDYINAISEKDEIVKKINPQKIYEIIFRNAAMGYYYRLAEGLVYGL